jgi:hypothetical protein
VQSRLPIRQQQMWRWHDLGGHQRPVGTIGLELGHP